MTNNVATSCSSLPDIDFDFWLSVAHNIESDVETFRESSHLLDTCVANTYRKTGRGHNIVHPALICANKLDGGNNRYAAEMLNAFVPLITDTRLLDAIDRKMNAVA